EFEWVEEIPLAGAGKRRLVISRLAGPRLSSPAPLSAGDPSLGEMEAIAAAGAGFHGREAAAPPSREASRAG
ncbi:MAG: hypothetical protein JOZ15_20315, partial [Acidobacteria bacterium]|nr:hypothetical protein [Acidobacteriota bacterium]